MYRHGVKGRAQMLDKKVAGYGKGSGGARITWKKA